jgi:methylated-DNA-[protein]-cysteine S-methyltransferase
MNLPDTAVQRLADSPIGQLRLVASPVGLAGLWFVERQRHAPDACRVASWPTADHHPILDRAIDQLRRYFAGTLREFALPLDLDRGTDFQRAVWQALRDIPAGRTCSYADLAVRIGRPHALRAVGTAVGRNPLGIVIPCHRVMGSDGSLRGYAGGLDRKKALLLLESGLPSTGPQTPCL